MTESVTQSAAGTIAPVVREVTVKAPAPRAFDFFTRNMTRWWPSTHHIAPRPFAEIVVEPETGGRWFERSADGEECSWGTVLDWDPPTRVIFAWHITPDFQFDPNPAHASRVEIRFLPVDERTTRVVLEHSEFERHGKGSETLMKSVGSEGGWGMVLRNFAERAEQQ